MNDLQNSYQQENNYDFKIDSNYILKSKSISENKYWKNTRLLNATEPKGKN